jgi:hypothetical protein
MHKKKIKFIIQKYLNVVLDKKVINNIFKVQRKLINELSDKLSDNFDCEKSLNDYLDFIYEYIEGLNEYFKKEKKGRVSYSKILVFANKDEKISEFLMDRALSTKKHKNNKSIAGFDNANDSENEDLSGFSVPFKNKICYFIFEKEGFIFCYNMEIEKLVVYFPDGSIYSYKKYKKYCLNNNKKYIGRIYIYNQLRNRKDLTDIQKSYNIYIRQERARIARRKIKS